MSYKGVWLERDLIMSKAFAKLNATGIRMLLAFLGKRRLENRGSRKRSNWVIANNGEIEFTYQEAKAKYGIKQFAFCSNRDNLVELGFVDIAKEGAGLYKSKTLYSISERWRKYGTPDFEKVTREPDSRHIGYQKRNVSR